MQPETRRSLTVIAIALLSLAAASTLVGPAIAQSDNTTNVSDIAPYYENNSTSVQNDTWLEGRGDATLENTTGMFARIGTFVVGSGVRGENVWAGPLVLGLVLVGAALGALAGTAGIVAGSVVGVALVATLVQLGLAPAWVWAVVLFALGLVATTVYIRLNR